MKLYVVLIYVLLALSLSAQDSNSTSSDSNSSDLIIDDDSANKQVTISEDTNYTNVSITNNQGDNQNYSATGDDGVKIIVTDDFNLSATADNGNSFFKVQNGGLLSTQDVNMSDQTYIYGDNADLTIKDAYLDGNASIESNNSKIIINIADMNSTAYIAGYNSSDIKVDTALMDINTTIYIEAGELNITNVIAKDNTKIYSKNKNSKMFFSDLNLSNNAYIYSDGEISLDSIYLKDNSYIESNQSSITIDKRVVLDNNSSIYAIYGDIVKLKDVALNDNSKIYTDSADINITGSLNLKDNSYIYSKNANIKALDLNLSNNAYIYANAKINLNSIYLKDSSYIESNQSDLIIDGLVNMENNSSLYAMNNARLKIAKDVVLNDNSKIYTKNSNIELDSNTTLYKNSYIYSEDGNLSISVLKLYNNANVGTQNGDINISVLVLEDNASIYSKSKLSTISLKDVKLKDSSSIYSDGKVVIDSDSLILEDNASIYSKTSIDIASDLYLRDNASILASNLATITLDANNFFNSKNSGIFIKDKDSNVSINLNGSTTLSNGAYITNSGKGSVNISKLNILDKGFVIANNNIYISDINISSNIEYALIDSNNHKVIYKNIYLPKAGNFFKITAEIYDDNISFYKDNTDPATYNLSKDNRMLYYSLRSSLVNSSNQNMLNLLDKELSKDEFIVAIKTMKPVVPNTSISSINNLNSSIDILKDHLFSKTDRLLSTNIWFKQFNVKSTQNPHNDMAGYSLSGNGFMIGSDKKIDFQTIYGVALSYTQDSLSSSNSLTNSTLSSTQEQLYLYISKNFKYSYIQSYFSKGIAQNSSKRDIILADKTDQARAKYKSDISNLTFLYGLKYKHRYFKLKPFAILSTSVVSTGAYREKTADGLNLDVVNKDFYQISILGGFETSYGLIFGNNLFIPALKYSYRKDLGDNQTQAVAKFENSDYTFKTDGIALDSSYQNYGFSLKYFNKKTVLETRVDINRVSSKNFQSDMLSFSIRYPF